MPRAARDPQPDFIKDEHLKFLDELRDSGRTNMFGAAPYLMEAFPTLSKHEAGKTLVYWMETFALRHSGAA